MIDVDNSTKGIVRVTIHTHMYGETGRHWKKVLSGPNQGGYGRIYAYRPGAPAARRTATEHFRGVYKRDEFVDLDECPGAMFDWETNQRAHAEFCDAQSNRKLGSELGWKLRPFGDFIEVKFDFT